MRTTMRNRGATLLLALGLVAAASGYTCDAFIDPQPPLSHEGRWLTDAAGRVVLLHGVNEVSKSAPFYPAAFGFGGDDADFLAEQGFNAVRLGVDFRGVMPEPGAVNAAYIE